MKIIFRFALSFVAFAPVVHAEMQGRRSPQFVPLDELSDVAIKTSGLSVRIETAGTVTQVSVPDRGEVFAVYEPAAEVADTLCQDETPRQLKGVVFCVVR